MDLSISPIAPHQASADMLCKLPEALREGRHTVWDFLQADVHNADKLAVLGAPGSGKTTLLKHVALTFAHRRSPTPRLKARHNVPILLFLREHAAKIISQPSEGRDAEQKTETPTLSGLIAKFCKEKRDLNISPGWFDRLLAKGRCIVMFDGLDEVADPETRKAIVAWVERQMTIHARNRFVVTSRPHGYEDNPLAGVNVLDIRTFSWRQVVDFVHRWYVAIEIKAQQRDDAGVRRDAKHEATDLLDRLHHGASALADLSVNPLLLTMIANVHRFRSSLPGRRVELYAEIFEVSLGKRQQSKGLTLDLAPAQKQRVLQPLAWRMMSEQIRDLSKDDASSAIASTLALVSPNTEPIQFLVSVENDSSLLLEREGGVYAFAHLTFQEFLAACHARQQPDLVEVLVQNVGESWWWECLRLFAATGDATAILEACLRKDPPDPEALALAIECRGEAKEIDPHVRSKLDHLIETGLDEMDPIKRRPLAEAMLKLRVGRMHRLDEYRYIDLDLVTHAEYQLFLEELYIKGEYHQPDHWVGTHYVADQGRKPVIGLRFSDAKAFCTWLTEREGGSWRFRPPTDDENAIIDPAWDTHEIEPWRLATPDSDAASQLWPVSIKERQSALNYTALKGLWHVDLDRITLALTSAPALQRDLAHALDRALDRARTHARTYARVLACSDLDHTRTLAHALAHAGDGNLDRGGDLALALASAHDIMSGLDRALDLGDFASAHDLMSDLAVDLGDFDRAPALQRDLAHALQRALAHAGDLHHDLARAGDLHHAHNLQHVRALAVDLDRALDCARTFDLASAHDLMSDLTSACHLVRYLTSILDHTRDLARTLARDLDRDLARTLALALVRTLVRTRDLDLLPLARLEMIKICNLLWARDIDEKMPMKLRNELYEFLFEYSYLICMLWFASTQLLPLEEEQLTVEDSDRVVSGYVFAAFKNSRIKGEAIPFEALRLVKEKGSA